MKEAQAIFGLFIVLVITISMGLQFSNKEGFHNTFSAGSKLDYKPITKIKDGDKNGATRYLGLAYIGVANPPKSIAFNNLFDDMPTYW